MRSYHVFLSQGSLCPNTNWQLSSVSIFSLHHTFYFSLPFAPHIGNSRRPQIITTYLVDIYLFDANLGRQILHFANVNNPMNRAGLITALVNDTWLSTDGLQWNGKNLTNYFYWVITPSNTVLGGSQIPQVTFFAVREFTFYVLVAS